MYCKQRGASTIGTLIVIIFGVLLLLLAVKLTPIYLDDMTVSNILEQLKESDEIKGKSPPVIKETIQKRFQVNNVKHIGVKDIKVVQDGGIVMLDLNYEVRSNILRNVDIVVSFEHHYELDTRK